MIHFPQTSLNLLYKLVADQLGNAVLFHEFRHVEADQPLWLERLAPGRPRGVSPRGSCGVNVANLTTAHA